MWLFRIQLLVEPMQILMKHQHYYRCKFIPCNTIGRSETEIESQKEDKEQENNVECKHKQVINIAETESL